jgi:glycosyltransferase involved in cell wall biosynthesis
LRLLVVTRGLEPATLDPVSTWVYDLTAGLAARGHRVTVLCTEEAGADLAREASDPADVDVRRPEVDEVAAALELALEQAPDVVHLAGPGSLPAASLRALEPTALLVDLVDWSPLCPAADLLLRPHGTACEQHFPIAPCGECVGHVHTRAFEPFMTLARAGHHVLAHTTYARDRATLALGRGVALLPAGVDGRRFSREAAPALAPEVAALAVERDRPRVTLLGPPTAARGALEILNLLVALHARVPGLEFVVAGTDPADPDSTDILRTEARELGIAHLLRVLPRVTPTDLPALLAACDLGLAPGPAPDPLGLSLVQALAVALPIVAHPVGSAPELLLQGEAGVLADSSQVGPFSDQVAALLADASLRSELGEKGRLAALERHDLDRALYDVEALYDRVRLPRSRRVLGATDPSRRSAA